MARKKTVIKLSSLKNAQNFVRGSRNPLKALSSVRSQLSPTEIDALVGWLPSVRHKGRNIDLGLFPTDGSALWGKGALASVGIQVELAWAASLIVRHSEQLSAFLILSSEYANHLLKSEYARCFELIEQIEKTFGASLWVIETKLALLQRAEGLESQKNYAALLIKARTRNDIVAFITYHLSRRNEPNTTPMRYIQSVDAMVSNWEDADDLAAYVRYRLSNLRPVGGKNYANVLRYEASASLIDHYDTFVRLANSAAADGDSHLRKIFLNQTIRVAEVVDDERVRRAAFVLTNEQKWLEKSIVATTDAHDAILAGNYNEALKIASCKVEQDPLDVGSWFDVAHASASLEEPQNKSTTFCWETIERLRRLLGRSNEINDAIIALLKDGLNHRLHGFSAPIEAQTWGELSSDPGLALHFAKFTFGGSTSIRPAHVGCLDAAAARTAVAKKIYESVGRSTSLADQVIRADISSSELEDYRSSLPELLPEAALEAQTALALRLGQHKNVIELAKCFGNSSDRLRSRRSKRYFGHSLLETDRIPELVSFIAKNCVLDDELATMLPLPECANRLDKDLRKKLAGNLAVPVVLDLFSKQFEASLDEIRSYAYEDFLLAYGIEKPSQLDGMEGAFDHGLLIYYLRHICIPDIMQVSSAFQGTRELEDERKSVLSLLVKLDPERAKEYETELRDVTRAQLIHRGVRHVERSKIYVEVPSIRRAFEKSHRETFQRYLALIRAGIGTTDHELEALLMNALSGKSVSQQVLEVPKNEANDLLLDMVRWLFFECTANPEHGLDCYLSMRIRHGTLSGQLRTPLEVQRIITQRAAGTDQYESNEHWLNRMPHLSEEIRSAIDGRLAQFSTEYDEFTARIANELIQIRSSDKPKGLFNIELRSVRFRLWISDLQADITLDAFFERLMDLFWGSVGDSLVTVRRTIDEHLKPEMTQMFGDLENGIKSLAGTKSTTDLDRAVRTAQTGTLQALDIVKDWFQLSQPISEPDFPIGDLIDVGLQCVTAIHRDFAPEVLREVDQLPPFANALVLFSDIFFIIFDNIRRHSGMGSGVKVDIRVQDKGDRLRIVTKNEVDGSVKTEDSIDRIDQIKRAIADGDYQRAVKSEGGTGLIKLRRLIGHSDGGQRRLDFGFDDIDMKFFVELEIGKREIQL